MESVYTPLTGVQYKEMSELVNRITAELPNDHTSLSLIWNNFKIVTGRTDAQPCGCRSTAKYWGEAVDTLKRFIESVELKKQEQSLHITTNPPIH